MEEERKGNGLSRRSFLKDIGGGAIGTAVISTGLVKSDPAEAYTSEATGLARSRSVVNLKVNSKSLSCRGRASQYLGRGPARSVGSHRHQDRL